MSTTLPSPARTAFARRSLGLLAPIGPLAMAGWSLAVPYGVADEPAVWISKAAAATGRLQVAMWMLLVFALTAGAGAIVTGLVARAGSLRVGTAGMVLAFAGFAGLSFSGAGYDAAAIASRQAGLDLAATQKVLDRIDTFQAPAVGAGSLVLLMFAGVLLLGVALWRGGCVPRWAALSILIAPPVILAGGFAAMPVNALGWALLAAGFAAAGFTFARTRP
ncbi:hypothetical protein AB0K48_01930 [Nonomuraea sp. NPDC055795]